MRPTRMVSLAALLLLSVPGCLVPVTQLNQCQAQNRALTSQNRAQLTEIENLKAHSRSVEDRLQSTEVQLARVEEQRELDRAQLAAYERERSLLGEQLQEISPLPGRLPQSVREQLEALAARHPSLRFDPVTGMGKLDSDVLFDSGEVEMKEGARELLVHLARILKSPEGSELKVMVVGHTDDRPMAKRPARDQYPDNLHLSTSRALAVATCLRDAGLPAERIGVAGMGAHEPVAASQSDKDRQRNRRVEIFVMARETPVVGWTETIPSVYR
ncbi:MAG: OmpA family protein [Planctomycetota bacterium]